MRARLVTAALLTTAAMVASASTALADDKGPTKPEAKPAPAAEKPAAPKGADASKNGPRRDPAGKAGISPFMEAIVRGDRAYGTADYAGATESYGEAARLDPEATMPLYRRGLVELAQGKYDDCEQTLQKAAQKKGTDELQAKVLFVLAELRERTGKWQLAKDAWSTYAAFVEGHPKAHGYADTAIERQKQIDRRVKYEKDFGAVKERIERRQKELEKEAEESAKKDKLNK
jgi:tetratricopeptide (TPR) repeat protein